MSQELFLAASQYLKSARGGLTRPEIFTPALSCNLAIMAMENASVGLLQNLGVVLPHFSLHAAREFFCQSGLRPLPMAALDRLCSLSKSCGSQSNTPAFDPEKFAELLQGIEAFIAAAQKITVSSQGTGK